MKIEMFAIALLLAVPPVCLSQQAASTSQQATSAAQQPGSSKPQAESGDLGPLEISPKPPPPPAPPTSWQGLIGEYGTAENKGYVLERGGSLYFRMHDAEQRLTPAGASRFSIDGEPAVFSRSGAGDASTLTIGGMQYPRLATGVTGGVFRSQPVKPVAELRKFALTQQPPTEKRDFLPPDLVEVVALDPTIKLDIGYATTRNFLSTPVYSSGRAFLQRPAAEAVVRANRRLRPLGYGLLIHDAYRPWYVTKIFWDATPPDLKKFVADPAEGSRHNRGCAVDITLYSLKTGKEIVMTGAYDETSERSYPTYPGGTSLQRWHRDLLRKAMEEEGFRVYQFEWWHFDYKDWNRYPILNVSFEAIKPTSHS